MTSKSLQVILIVILSVLAYSCREDNPVVEPPENPDSLKIVSVSKEIFKKGDTLLLTYKTNIVNFKLKEVLVDDNSAKIINEQPNSVTFQVPEITSDSFKIKISDGKISASSKWYFNPKKLRILNVTPKYFKLESVLLFTINQKKSEFGSISKVFLGEIQHDFTYKNDSIIAIKPLPDISSFDSVKVKIIRNKETAESAYIYFCSSTFYDYEKLYAKRISGRNITENDTIVVGIYAARANERTMKFYLNNKKIEYLSWKIDSQDGNQFVRVTLLAPKLPIGYVTLRVVDYLGSYEINDFNYVENKDNIKSLEIKIAKIRYLRYNRTTEYFGGGGGSKVSTFNDTMFYDLNVKMVSIKAENFYSDLSKFGYFNEYSDGDHSIGPPPTSSSSTGQYSYFFSKDQTNNKFLGIELISSNKYDFSSGASFNSHSENSTSILLNNVEFSYDYLSKKYTIILKGEDVLKHISTFIFSKSSRGGDPGHYLTEDRYAIKLLENQPPDASIEISFELY